MRWHLRIAALTSAAFYLAALFVAGYHQAEEAHGYCPEHGAPVHLDETVDGGHAAHLDLKEAMPLGAVAAAAGHHATHGCALFEWLSQSAAGEAAVAQTRAALRSVVVAKTGLAVAPTTIAILRLSPKSSPPA